ncbi:hypothetical protein ACO2I3_01050 [Leptospira interrogans]
MQSSTPALPADISRPRGRWPYQVGRRPLSIERMLQLIESLEAVEKSLNRKDDKAALAREREMLTERTLFMAEDRFQLPCWDLHDVRFLLSVHAAVGDVVRQ